MENPEIIELRNPHWPAPLDGKFKGFDGFKNPQHVREYVNWAAKRCTGLTATELFRVLDSKYPYTALQRIFRLYRSCLDSFSQPNERVRQLSPNLDTGFRRR